MSLHEKGGKLSGSQEIDREFQIVLKQNASNYFDPELSRSLDHLSKRLDPPSNNMGGTYPLPPLFFPHGEILPAFVASQETKIDWLAFTSPADLDALQALICVIWPGVVFARNRHGMPGYPDSSSILLDGIQFGQIGFGAKHGKNFVSLTGTACRTLTDELVVIFHEALSLPGIGGVLSRLDLCLDLYRGERTFDHALWSYEHREAFKRPRANSQPELKIVGTSKDGENLGRTMYVGKRGGHVMARIYEKGLEVFAKLPEEMRLMSDLREKDLKAAAGGQDDPVMTADQWVRLEVEYRRQGKDILLPLDMMVRRDEYFAGAYPYFADSLGMTDGVRPAGLKTEFDVDLQVMINNAKNSYGSLIHSLKQLGASDEDVVVYLSSGRNNNRLVKSGLLSRLKESVAVFNASLDPDSDIPF